MDAVRCMSVIGDVLNKSRLATALEILLNEQSAACVIIRRDYTNRAFMRQQDGMLMLCMCACACS